MTDKNAHPLSPLSTGTSPRSDMEVEEGNGWKISGKLGKLMVWQRCPRLTARLHRDPDEVFLAAESALTIAQVPEKDWWDTIAMEKAEASVKRRMMSMRSKKGETQSASYQELRDEYLQRWGVLEPLNTYDCAMARLECNSVDETIRAFEKLHQQYLRASARENSDRPIPEDRMAFMLREALPTFVRERLTEHLRLMRITNPRVSMTLAQTIEAARMLEEECLRARAEPVRREAEEGEVWGQEQDAEEGVIGDVKQGPSDVSTASSPNRADETSKRLWWEANNETSRCYRCNGYGHRAAYCQSRQISHKRQRPEQTSRIL